MARIPDGELERLKREVSLVRLLALIEIGSGGSVKVPLEELEPM